MAENVEKEERIKDKKEFGKRLRNVIEALGVRQRLLAAKLNFSPGYINDVLQGRTRPSLQMLIRMRTIYNVSPSYVIVGEGPMFMPADVNGAAEEPGAYTAGPAKYRSPRDILGSPLGLTGWRELTRTGHPWVVDLLDILPAPVNQFLEENPAFRKQFDPLCAMLLEEIVNRAGQKSPESQVKLAVDTKRALIKLFEAAFRLWSTDNEAKLNYLLKSLDAF